ncbi:aminotransferase class IV [Flavobacteriaceae bacterium S356]|uniref:branched-chain-amino-acid transaminase n=1 Tax=Asprobacillus argus TaxID=3076534 RepID=A0ABU3LCU7_9FLAO|nr:aminotransferase class IV [Flavobacteriaceae bacterium S356]
MLNFNGTLVSDTERLLSVNNRGFKFGDALFETMKIANGKVIFWEDHYFRLMASMRMLRMKIPMDFTLENLEKEILKTIPPETTNTTCRGRLSVFRKDGGLYTPATNEVDFLIEISELKVEKKEAYRIDLFKDFYNYSGLLSTLKTNNKMLSTVASVYAEENDLDNCVLLNERKGVVEVTNGNIFVIKGNTIKTPALTEGCLKGVLRKKIIEIIESNDLFTIEETVISPFEIQKADEVFITNAIVGIQAVTNYRKKTFVTDVSDKLSKSLRILEITGKA